MKVTILGSGTSCGVPAIGCECEVCRSTDWHDKRLRASALVEVAGKRILIDCGPDFRQQMLTVDFAPLDAVLITHEHYDHVGGLDDLRPYCMFGDVKVYADAYSVRHLLERIPYCFAENPYPGVPRITLETLTPGEPLLIGDVEIVPLKVMHGKLPILGYRIGRMAYITDMKSIDADQLSLLDGVDTLFVNGLRRFKTHHSHQSLEEALSFIERIAPRKSYILHMSHEIGLHAETQKILPQNVSLTYDGMVVECE